MEVKYSPEIRPGTEAFDLLKPASTKVKSALESPSVKSVEPEWTSLKSDEGKTLYRFLVYDGSVRKVDLLKKRLAELPAPERAPAIEKIKVINPSFTAP